MSESTSLEMPGLDDVQEEQLLDSSSYDIEIVVARENTVAVTDRDTGEEVTKKVVNFTLVAQGEVDKQPIYHTLWLPGEDDTQDEVIRAQRQVKRFLSAFNIESVGGSVSYADFIGKTAHLSVKQKNDKNGEPRVNVQIPRF